MNSHEYPSITSVRPEPFEPSLAYTLGIRGGPLLPGKVIGRFGDAGNPITLADDPKRYALVYSEVAPTGQRLAIGLVMLGLADRISVINANGKLINPMSDTPSWSNRLSDSELRSVKSSRTVRLPVLVDDGAVVSNDPYGLLFALQTAYYDAKSGGELYPSRLADLQREWTQRIFFDLHAAVYRAGFVTNQTEYETEANKVHGLLFDLEKHLGERSFLLDQLTDADIWLFCLLIRFDQIYGPAFRLHRYRIRDFPPVHRYVRNLYRMPIFKSTTNFLAISQGYHLGIPALNTGVVPFAPDDIFLRG
jgi:putative glutathione S-transferase